MQYNLSSKYAQNSRKEVKMQVIFVQIIYFILDLSKQHHMLSFLVDSVSGVQYRKFWFILQHQRWFHQLELLIVTIIAFSISQSMYFDMVLKQLKGILIKLKPSSYIEPTQPTPISNPHHPKSLSTLHQHLPHIIFPPLFATFILVWLVLRNVNLLMKKRSSKKEQHFETVRQQNYSLTASSPLKTPLPRDNTLSNFRREKPFIELPKIFPSHNHIKHKRYLESCLINDENTLNLVGMKYNRMLSREKKGHEETSEPIEAKRERPVLQKQETQRQLFIESVLASNGISRILFQKKEKVKVFIDEGNNSRLINELMRRRANLKIVASKKEANIVWTPFCDWQQANEGSIFWQNERKDRQNITSYTEHADTHPLTSKTEEIDRYKTRRYRDLTIQQLKMHNHLKNHYQISDKKCLFKNIKKYCKNQKINEHDIIPKTYHIDGNLEDLPVDICSQLPIWIVKPGEDTNRGTGISVQEGRENIVAAIKELASFGKSSLVQEYIDPLLYKNRKFDLRCYALITSYCGNLKAYWYKQGYIRTCCKEFNYDPQNVYGHLTNDAVQKKHKDYGKYEQCNKLSFSDLEAFLKTKEISYANTIERMKQLVYISIKSAEDKLRAEKNMFAFEIFGYDFLIDSKGKVWLIEINTNPCLDFSGSLLSRVIWHMVENSFAIAIDPLLLCLPESYNSWRDKNEKIYEDNKFQLVV